MNVQQIFPPQNNPHLITALRNPRITIRRIVNAELLQIQDTFQDIGFGDPFSFVILEWVRTFRTHHLAHPDAERVFQRYAALLQEALVLQMAMYIDNPPSESKEPFLLVCYMKEWLDKHHLADGLNDLWTQYNRLYNQRMRAPASGLEIVQRRRAIQAERRRQRQDREYERVREIIPSIRNDFIQAVVPHVELVIQEINAAASQVLANIEEARVADDAALNQLRQAQEQLKADIMRLEGENLNIDLDLQRLQDRIDVAEKEDKQFQKDLNNLETQIKKNKKKWIKDLLKAGGGVLVSFGVGAVFGSMGIGFIPLEDGGQLNVLFKV